MYFFSEKHYSMHTYSASYKYSYTLNPIQSQTSMCFFKTFTEKWGMHMYPILLSRYFAEPSFPEFL